MYSIILATVLTTGAVEPVNWGCHGCHGCCGGCWGCCGGCYGCCGGCWGCYGCCGGCWGCWGGCYGCYGCCGGCWGCYGCCGGCWGCYGCWGGYGYYPVAVAPVVAAAPVATAMPVGSAATTPGGTQVLPAAPQRADLGNAAAVILKAPTAARLTVEGRSIPRTAAQESFRTPALEPGASYLYTFKAESVRDGKPVTYTKQINVRAGQVSEADFTKLLTEGKDTARVTVKLPSDARLYVDGVVCPLTSATRSFNTPDLPAGRSYFYNLKAEVVRDGETRIATKRVVVEAGKQVTIEFKDLSSQTASR